MPLYKYGIYFPNFFAQSLDLSHDRKSSVLALGIHKLSEL